MAKNVSTDWKVVVGTTDLSSWAFDVAIADEKEQVDVSGFNPLGNRSYIPGLAEQTVTIQFVNDRASGGPHQTVLPLYTGGSVFRFFVQPDSDAGTSTANPIYGGSASVYSFPSQATLNEREEVTYEFRPASNSSFSWGTVAP